MSYCVFTIHRDADGNAWKRLTWHTIAWPFIVLSKSTRANLNGYQLFARFTWQKCWSHHRVQCAARPQNVRKLNILLCSVHNRIDFSGWIDTNSPHHETLLQTIQNWHMNALIFFFCCCMNRMRSVEVKIHFTANALGSRNWMTEDKCEEMRKDRWPARKRDVQTLVIIHRWYACEWVLFFFLA